MNKMYIFIFMFCWTLAEMRKYSFSFTYKMCKQQTNQHLYVMDVIINSYSQIRYTLILIGSCNISILLNTFFLDC